MTLPILHSLMHTVILQLVHQRITRFQAKVQSFQSEDEYFACM